MVRTAKQAPIAAKPLIFDIPGANRENRMLSLFTKEALEVIRRRAELTQELAALLERANEVEDELRSLSQGSLVPKASKSASSGSSASGSTATQEAPRKRGRPRKDQSQSQSQSQAQDQTTDRKRGRPKKVQVTTDDGKQMDLPHLLETIAQEVGRPLKQSDFVTLVREAGYKSQAKDFSNMIYQSLLKLVKRGVLEKDSDNRTYTFSGKAA